MNLLNTEAVSIPHVKATKMLVIRENLVRACRYHSIIDKNLQALTNEHQFNVITSFAFLTRYSIDVALIKRLAK